MPVEAWHAWRTMRLLELLAFAPLSAPQLAEAIGAQPRTVRRVLGRLVEDEYVMCSGDRHRIYQPTMRLVAMAAQLLDRSPFAQQAGPYVALLLERTGATAQLVMPSYESVFCVIDCIGPGEVPRPQLGQLTAAHCTAGGKVLLARRERWRESLLAAPLARLTEHTVTDPRALRRQLETVRDLGYAVDDRESDPDTYGVAAAVWLAGSVQAALVVSGPRLDVPETARLVVQTARELSEHLAGSELTR
jgi:DNA-binding IclR family transcriptional regulator